MELKQFVKQSLIDIMEGVHDASEHIENQSNLKGYSNNNIINPLVLMPRGDQDTNLSTVDFSVQANIKSGRITVEDYGNSKSTDENSLDDFNIIRFKVPVMYPFKEENISEDRLQG